MMFRLLIVLLLLLLSACTPEAALLRKMEESSALMERWLTNNVKEKGIFRYTRNTATGEEPSTNNPIRQLMAARLLAELATEHPELLALHRKNLAFYLRYWYRETEDGPGYVFYDDSSKLGSNALLLRTFVASPDFPQHAEKAAKVAQGIFSLMDAQGALRPWFIEPDRATDHDYLLTFYSGEALLALFEYAAKTGDASVLARAIQSQEYYIRRYVAQMETHYYPAYVPWHTMSIYHLWERTGDDRYADAIFALNDKLLELLDRTEYVGRFYNPLTPQYGSPHSSSDGVYTEGLAYALDTAIRMQDATRMARYTDALTLAVTNLMNLQITNGQDTGAIRIRADNDWIRIDTVQHALDAFRKARTVLH